MVLYSVQVLFQIAIRDHIPTTGLLKKVYDVILFIIFVNTTKISVPHAFKNITGIDVHYTAF
jgi:TRAP-type C4-dicarboxylate transport system permease small subunit